MEEEEFSQDSLDLNSFDDISLAIEKYEKMLGTDMKNSGSLNKMKSSQGSSEYSWGINDRENSIEEEQIVDSKNTKISEQALNDSTEDSSSINHLLSNSNFSLTQYLDTNEEDQMSLQERLEKQNKLIISKIKKMCDIFSKYDNVERELYLQEMHLILLIIPFKDIIDSVLPSFSIFVEETEVLKLKFLQKLPFILENLIQKDFETAIDQIVLNIFPTLENILKKSSEDIQGHTTAVIKDI
mmetsp:Transcript_17072/g.15026  ORF Transcript_17072/g.15026 Transcript_17072/m.15026 type:complete len:241 (+) Transcript_17072:264-986(+)